MEGPRSSSGPGGPGGRPREAPSRPAVGGGAGWGGPGGPVPFPPAPSRHPSGNRAGGPTCGRPFLFRGTGSFSREGAPELPAKVPGGGDVSPEGRGSSRSPAGKGGFLPWPGPREDLKTPHPWKGWPETNPGPPNGEGGPQARPRWKPKGREGAGEPPGLPGSCAGSDLSSPEESAS